MKKVTQELVARLKEAGENWEWYPTTDEMIAVVKRWIPEDAHSIMDIGAGDGRVLARLAEKCKNAMLYSIEISIILVQAQPKNVIPVGTDLFEQKLSSLPVDYAFCNPRYSQYEEWVCKIVDECYAKKVFLVIPQRWKESKLIEKAVKQRGATTRVLNSGDFLSADRKARAVIDIVEVGFPRDLHGYTNKPEDPFNIWFDANVDTFDKAKEVPKDETRSELAMRYADANINEMAEHYRAEYKVLVDNYQNIFKLDYAILKELGIDKNHVREGLKKKMSGLKIKYWEILFDRLDAITSRLTTKSKDTLLKKLTLNASVEFTETNAYTVVLWAIKNANQYFEDQLVDLFMEMSCFENVLNYKSNVRTWEKDGWRYGNRERKNTHYALDYRIVVSQYAAIQKDQYGSYDHPGHLHRNCHNLIADIRAVLSNLGFKSNTISSYNREWIGGEWQDFLGTDSETLFQAKAYMNGNIHFRFKPEAIKAFNIQAGRLLKWVRTEEEVVTEMGYTKAESKKYFNQSLSILPSNVQLLKA